MQNSLFLGGVVCVSFIAAPVASDADTIASDIPNGLFAPLTIIEDHPQCNGPGQTAFKVEFETGEVSYTAQHVQSLREASISSDGVILEEEARCFVGHRSGTELRQVEVSCNGGELQRSPFDARNLSQTSISISGTFTACHSPFAFEIMDSSWRAQINEPKGPSEVTGTVFQNPVEGCENAVQVLEPRLYLRYVQTTSSGIPLGIERRFPYDDVDVVSPASPTFFRLIFNDIPVLLNDNNSAFATVDTQVFLFPTDQGVARCPAGLCTLPRFVTNMSNVSRHARKCP
ncbi:hypothetical protein C7964_10274 [Loktanella sp. PT4BL]|jgi:hypothetical protein|uniref:hypothetical protein n=1 Tax=Loktanella sp. PT4BL TaxID=2135611 RepID=UPI000D766C1F|nr:hypothetical protein [Loktanella sp. PT4BL]PXW70190.1 hypothetical protein C7964_10274 [Loktanella sp. PT4BL]